MSALDSVARLEKLGVSLAVEDLCEVEHLHIANSACSPDFAEAIPFG